MNYSLRFVAALAALQNYSGAEVARRIDMEPSNFSASMSGKRKFPADKWERLCGFLQLTESGLRTDVVHFWRVPNSVSNLSIVAETAFPHGANYGGVWREGAGPFDLARVLDVPLVVLTDGRTRAVIRSDVGLFATPDPINPSSVPSLRARLGQPTGYGRTLMISIPGKQFKRWEAGDIPVAEFDRAVGVAKGDRPARR